MMQLPLKQWVCALCTFLIGEVIPKFHVHAMLIDMVRQVYRSDALKCADHNCLQFVFRNVISAIFKSPHQSQIAIALCNCAIISTRHYFHFYSIPLFDKAFPQLLNFSTRTMLSHLQLWNACKQSDV